MPGATPIPNPSADARHASWQRFCRPGRRWAAIGAVIWMTSALLLFVLMRFPAPPPRHASPPPVQWIPPVTVEQAADREAASDFRVLWNPAIFALSSPIGFSAGLSGLGAGIAPPDLRPSAPAIHRFDFQTAENTPAARLKTIMARDQDKKLAEYINQNNPTWPAAALFDLPPTSHTPAGLTMEFSDEWASRMFSGIDMQLDRLGPRWAIRVELEFDAVGIPRSVILAQSSGLSAIDRLAIRSMWDWRLQEPTAPRRGSVHIAVNMTPSGTSTAASGETSP